MATTDGSVKTEVVRVPTVTQIVENTSCNTSHLSSLFASFLTGGGVIEMSYQKYFMVFKGDCIRLCTEYEKDYRMPTALVDRIDVRISSTSRDNDGYYYATFIGTINGSIPHINTETTNTHPEKLSVALVVGDKILAFAPVDLNVYKEALDGSRVEIKWKLQLKHVTTIKEVHEYDYVEKEVSNNG